DADSDADTDADTDVATGDTGGPTDTGPTQPFFVTVQNDSFEAPQLSAASDWTNGVSGWSGGGVVWLGPGSMFQTSPLAGPATGNQALFLLDGAQSETGSLRVVREGWTVHATVVVAERLDAGLGQSGTSRIELVLDGVVASFAELPNTTLRASHGQWNLLETSFVVDPGQDGQTLTVRLRSTDPTGQVVFDSVAVDITP
ncbi:MAG: hypothetical protein KC621_31510, partial [Myxococcales bacterium]|nr:hypothetical protein [Myxococcales bacterium]